MTDTEALQKLIEMAWENGWDGYDGIRRINAVQQRSHLSDMINNNNISFLFNHNFIKALCRGKYGEHQLTELSVYPGEREAYLKPYHKVLRALAITPEQDRIKYLTDTFLEKNDE